MRPRLCWRGRPSRTADPRPTGPIDAVYFILKVADRPAFAGGRVARARPTGIASGFDLDTGTRTSLRRQMKNGQSSPAVDERSRVLY